MAIIYQNTFTAADNTDVAAVTPEVGGAMVAVSGVLSCIVTGNRARTNGGSNYSVNVTPALGSDADYIVRGVGRLIAGACDFQLYGRCNAAADERYEVYYEPGYLALRRRNGGGVSTLGSTTSWTPSSGVDYTIELIHSGTSHSVKVNGTEVIAPVSNSDITAAARAGIECKHGGSSHATEGWHWASFEVDTLAAAPTITAALLDYFRRLLGLTR